MRSVILSVAPVAATETRLDAEAIAEDVVNCCATGAAMVHLHARNENGTLTTDLSYLKQTVDSIAAACDIIVQVSTGGVSNLTIAERCLPVAEGWSESHSLNVGSTNLGTDVYRNPIADVHTCVRTILTHQKIPEIEVFELGMIKMARELVDRYAFQRPILFSIVLGHAGAAPATPRTLRSMLDCLDEFFPQAGECLWGITHARREDFSMIEYALDLGASMVRVGFEDSDALGGGKRAGSNALLVKHVMGILGKKNLAAANPAKARRILGIR